MRESRTGAITAERSRTIRFRLREIARTFCCGWVWHWDPVEFCAFSGSGTSERTTDKALSTWNCRGSCKMAAKRQRIQSGPLQRCCGNCQCSGGRFTAFTMKAEIRPGYDIKPEHRKRLYKVQTFFGMVLHSSDKRLMDFCRCTEKSANCCAATQYMNHFPHLI